MGVHTRQELAALALLEEGLETRYPTVLGGWPDQDVMRRTHRDMLELQDHVRETSGTTHRDAADDDPVHWRPVLLVGLAIIVGIAVVLALAG